MSSIAPPEPRYPPWLRRALATKAKSDHMWSFDASKRSYGDCQAPADDSRLPGAVASDKRAPASITSPAGDVWEAAARDDVASVRELVGEDKLRVFVRRSFLRSGGGGESLLHTAASHGAIEVARYLVAFLETNFSHETQRQAVNAIDTQYSRTTPLIALCRSCGGAPLDRVEILKVLVRSGADTAAADAHGDNALHWCARNESAVMLRFLLKETDAGADAVFALNGKRETPLDIAQRQINRRQSLATSTVYSLLRNVDRECNLRLKMQLIGRGQVALSSQAMIRDSNQLRRCIEASELLAQRSRSVWAEALAHAEKRRQQAERDHAAAASERARAQAFEWLESKEGKAYMKKQGPVATAKVKQKIQSGAIAKPKDIKKAAAQLTAEAYVQEQAQSARQAAADAFRAKRPPYTSEGVVTSIEPLVTRLGL